MKRKKAPHPMLGMLEVITAVLHLNGYELAAPMELRKLATAKKVVRK